MFLSENIPDKIAISLSTLCAVHCLALPLIAIFLPAILAMPFADESFHLWMVFIVLPISIFALTMGCKKHNRYGALAFGLTGLAVLVLTALIGESYLGEVNEKLLTLIGATVIAAGHLWNYRLCRKVDLCSCTND